MTRASATPRKRPGGAPSPQRRSNRADIAAGSSNSFTGSIGPRQSFSSMARAPSIVGRPAIRDGVVIHAVELDGEIQPLARPGGAEEARFVRECRDGPAAKADVRHRRPGGELPDGFRHQAWREARDVRGNRERPARARARFERRDAVDEREGRKMIRHALDVHEPRSPRHAPTEGTRPLGVSASPVKKILQPAALTSRCAWTTSLQNVSGVKRRGMSATFIGVLKRSAGTSDR